MGIPVTFAPGCHASTKTMAQVAITCTSGQASEQFSITVTCSTETSRSVIETPRPVAFACEEAVAFTSEEAVAFASEEAVALASEKAVAFACEEASRQIPVAGKTQREVAVAFP